MYDFKQTCTHFIKSAYFIDFRLGHYEFLWPVYFVICRVRGIHLIWYLCLEQTTYYTICSSVEFAFFDDIQLKSVSNNIWSKQIRFIRLISSISLINRQLHCWYIGRTNKSNNVAKNVECILIPFLFLQTTLKKSCIIFKPRMMFLSIFSPIA